MSVVIPTRRRIEKLLRCIESVRASEADGLEVEVVVVADRDPDIRPAVQQRYPEIIVLDSHERLGSQGGRALAAFSARGEYLFFLDDDNVLDPGCIATLARVMAAWPELGLLGPLSLVFGTEGEVWSAGGHLSRPLCLVSYAYAGRRRDSLPASSLLRCEYAPNAFMVRRDATDLVEAVSRLFPHYWSEPAVSAELQARGLESAVSTECWTWHDFGYSGPFTRIGEGWTDEQARARLLWRRLYRPGFVPMAALWLIVFPVSSLAYTRRFLGAGDTLVNLRAYLRGTWQGLRTPACYPERPLFR